ncbi:Gfo/Idh/MocA family protein [Parasedimentitalea huanghaiensis]|uniref:Gfo/Idh/MocA family oxidoreductase n=1 Tax=Parasedimentitalea huanghaiensis TaxID=2682100 RepID=A0A6L6WQF4_9RHOB|nr:Gfo/Idh/MocA family oxidoreductase [Zongyanglinia huanghaiensis]MVO18147.1 gfo/Idh/MocA family oxidoreductase [Zongyanglinia huanghaiensis]
MLRWAVLGTGFISNAVATAIQQSDGSDLWTIAGRNQDAVQAFQRQFQIPNHSIGYEGALSDPNVDVVYIGLPNHVHHTLTAQAAASGKAVLSEKSLTTTMDQAHQLVTAVQSHKTFFVEGLMYLAHPLYHRLQEVLLDGRLGELRAIQGFYAADIWQVTNPLGRGTLYNLGCYPTSLMHLVVQTMCGEEMFATRRLSGFGNVADHDDTICDAAVTAQFGNGVLASLHSTDSYGMAHGFSISGSKGVLRFVTNPWLPVPGANHLQWCPYDGAVEDIYVETGYDAFYHQIKMVEQNLSQNRTEAQRPSPRLQDSVEIMAFLTEWEALCLNRAAD